MMGSFYCHSVGTEKDLQAQLSDISRSHKTELRDIEAISKTVDDTNLQDQKYREKVFNVQQLIKEIRLLLGEATLTIKSAVSFSLLPESPNNDLLNCYHLKRTQCLQLVMMIFIYF